MFELALGATSVLILASSLLSLRRLDMDGPSRRRYRTAAALCAVGASLALLGAVGAALSD